MIEEIKILLGESAANYTEAQISLAYRLALAEVEEYTKREADTTLELVAAQIAVIKLNRSHTEGLASQSFSGVNESYLDGYPAELQAILNRKRRVKVV